MNDEVKIGISLVLFLAALALGVKEYKKLHPPPPKDAAGQVEQREIIPPSMPAYRPGPRPVAKPGTPIMKLGKKPVMTPVKTPVTKPVMTPGKPGMAPVK